MNLNALDDVVAAQKRLLDQLQARNDSIKTFVSFLSEEYTWTQSYVNVDLSGFDPDGSEVYYYFEAENFSLAVTVTAQGCGPYATLYRHDDLLPDQYALPGFYSHLLDEVARLVG